MYLAEAILVLLDQIDMCWEQVLHDEPPGSDAHIDRFNEWTKARDDYRPLLEDIVRRFK